MSIITIVYLAIVAGVLASSGSRSAMMLAIQNDDPEAVRLAFNDTVDINGHDDAVGVDDDLTDSINLLAYAVLLSKFKAAKALVELGAHPSSMSKQNKGVFWALVSSQPDQAYPLVELLLQISDDVGSFAPECLHWAVSNNSGAALTKLLLNYRAYIESLNEEGETPLYLAIHYGCIGPIKVLLAAGANPFASKICKITGQRLIMTRPCHRMNVQAIIDLLLSARISWLFNRYRDLYMNFKDAQEPPIFLNVRDIFLHAIWQPLFNIWLYQ